MRVFLMLAAVSAWAVGLAACSDAPTSNNLAYSRRSQAGSGDTTPSSPASSSTPKGSTPGKPSSDAPVPPSSSSSTPAKDAGAPAPNQSPAPQPGSCQAPQCLGGGGTCGCKATNADGNLVVMGCQDGACACQGGITDTQFDGDCNSIDDAQQLFFTNCQCE